MLTPEEHDAEVLAAWVDGESSDRDEVLTALASPEGRAYVFDLMSIRRMVSVTNPAGYTIPAHTPRRLPRMVTAAAAAALCIVSGYGIAQLANRSSAIAPVVDSRETADEPAAPQPTHVIRFETGVDWRETTGGN